MAEPLKNQFGAEIPDKIARMIARVWPKFAADAFVEDALDGYGQLELMPRGRKIAHALQRYLPDDFEAGIEILIKSIGPKQEEVEAVGMAPFLYLPHVVFVAEYGLDHFEASMRAQYELTQRFTAEFSIRPFIERYTDETLARLRRWATDPSAHVRRLVSEGTRPRLPWASRLRCFQQDPRPVLALLELLKDDPELYVRRSVANNLNDIGKDHPALLAKTARRWLRGASEERRWLVRHGLRSALKRGEPGALAVMGFGKEARVAVGNVCIAPKRAKIGGSVQIGFALTNTDSHKQRVLVDFCIYYVKANGKASPKVFKLKTVELAPQETVEMSKAVSLRQMTTRKHYPGLHQVDVVLNGAKQGLGSFAIVPQ